jgi:hypothetical protein
LKRDSLFCEQPFRTTKRNNATRIFFIRFNFIGDKIKN